MNRGHLFIPIHAVVRGFLTNPGRVFFLLAPRGHFDRFTLLQTVFIVLVSSVSLRGAPIFEWRGDGPCSTGMGRCTVLVPDPGFCGMNNPSRTAEFPAATLSASTAAPFSVPGLRTSSIWFGRAGEGAGPGYGVGYSRFGSNRYREDRATGSLRLPLGMSAIGVACNVNRLAIEGVGQRTFVSATLGFATQENSRVRFGATVRDLFRFGAQIRNEVRPSGAVGVSVSLPSTDSLVLLEVRKQSLCRAAVSFGLETGLWETVFLRMGACSDPSLYSVGLSIALPFLSLDVGVEEHTVLGRTRSIGLTIFPGRILE